MKLITIKLILTFLSLPFIYADTLKVGVDKEFSFINEAVKAASPGDKIKIYPGYYDEFVIIENKNNLKISAKNGVTIKHVLIRNCKNIKLKRLFTKLHINNCENVDVEDLVSIYTFPDPHPFHGVQVSFSNKVEIEDSVFIGSFQNSIVVYASSDVEIEDCYIELSRFNAIFLCESTDIELEDNIFVNVANEISDYCPNNQDDD